MTSGNTTGTSTSSTAWVDIPDIVLTFELDAPREVLLISNLGGSAHNTNAGEVNHRFFVDDALSVGEQRTRFSRTNDIKPITNIALVSLATGVHEVRVQWHTNFGRTSTGSWQSPRTLTALGF